MRKVKNWWKKFSMSPMERRLSEAKDIYELESMIKQYSYVHNIKGWML